jgi:hypothetical protein
MGAMQFRFSKDVRDKRSDVRLRIDSRFPNRSFLHGVLRIFRKSSNERIIMKQFFALFLAIFTSASPVRANLGDGGDRIDDSYGNLVERHLRDDGTVSVVYHKDRYLYFVIFDNGVSVLERYSHVKGTDLSEKEIASFLKANAGGGTWMPDNKSKERHFKRSDHKAEATYANMAGRPTLTVRTLGTER